MLELFDMEDRKWDDLIAAKPVEGMYSDEYLLLKVIRVDATEIPTSNEHILILDAFAYDIEREEFLMTYVAKYMNGVEQLLSKPLPFLIPFDTLDINFSMQLSFFRGEEKEKFKYLDLMSV